MLGPGIRALDLQGGLLAVADGTDLVTVNLSSGEAKYTPIKSYVASAYVADSSTVFYATHPGCGPVEKTVVGRINVATGTRTTVIETTDVPGFEILGYNAAADELTITPRGCDPGLGEIWTVNAKTGEKKSTIPVEGCGWAALSPDRKQALISYDACIGEENDDPELRAYALPG